MKCPKCQIDNPEEADFCIECGNPIEFHCLKCGAKTPRKGKFCMIELIRPSINPATSITSFPKAVQ